MEVNVMFDKDDLKRIIEDNIEMLKKEDFMPKAMIEKVIDEIKTMPIDYDPARVRNDIVEKLENLLEDEENG